jgi:hypothetical protein
MACRSKLIKVTGKGKSRRPGLKKYNSPNALPTMESEVKAPLPMNQEDMAPNSVTPKERSMIEKNRVSRAKELPELSILASEISVYSEDEIKRISVVDVINPNITGNNLANPAPGSLFDVTMGSLLVDRKCSTCLQVDCQGHYGRIPFPYPIPHPHWLDVIPKILTCICGSCGSLLMKKENIKSEIYK